MIANHNSKFGTVAVDKERVENEVQGLGVAGADSLRTLSDDVSQHVDEVHVHLKGRAAIGTVHQADPSDLSTDNAEQTGVDGW